MGADLLISREQKQQTEAQTPSYYPNEEEKRIISAVKRKYRDKDLSKRAYEKTWFVTMSFLRGQHY